MIVTNLNYGYNLPFYSWHRIMSRKQYDVTVKLTFDFLDTTCHHFISLTFVS